MVRFEHWWGPARPDAAALADGRWRWESVTLRRLVGGIRIVWFTAGLAAHGDADLVMPSLVVIAVDQPTRRFLRQRMHRASRRIRPGDIHL